MATSPEAVRAQLADITEAATLDLAAVASQVPAEQRVSAVLETLPLLVPAYYDAAGSLAVAWYDERRDEARPATVYAPTIIGDPDTDWIEREVTRFRADLDAEDLEREAARLVDEAALLAGKEVARGFRVSIEGNARMDEDAIGWSRVARGGACKFCVMLAGRGAVFRKETVSFAAHKGCSCAARPEFRGGDHGPEASAMQYLASSKNRTPEQREKLRTYLNENYPDAPG